MRWAGPDINRMSALAQELVGLQPDIILTYSTAATVAVQRGTRTPRLRASHGRAWAVRAAMDDANALVPLPAGSGPGQASAGLAHRSGRGTSVPVLPLKPMPPQVRALPVGPEWLQT